MYAFDPANSTFVLLKKYLTRVVKTFPIPFVIANRLIKYIQFMTSIRFHEQIRVRTRTCTFDKDKGYTHSSIIKKSVRRGSWETHHKISTFLRRVCLSSRQVHVNLKREGSGRRSKVLFSRRRGRLYSMSTFVCRRYSRSHCPLVYPEVLTRFAYGSACLCHLSAKTGVYSTLARSFRATPWDVLLIEKSTRIQLTHPCSKFSRVLLLSVLPGGIFGI